MKFKLPILIITIGILMTLSFGINAQSIPTVTMDKPISEMTIPELQAKINELTQAIQQLQALLAQLTGQPDISGIPGAYTFNTNLKYGTSNTEVRYLQLFLNADPDTRVSSTGSGSPGKESMYFGPKTKQAVIKFQEKYASEILFPWNLTQGTGFVGQTTRAQINQLLAQYRTGVPLPPTPEVECGPADNACPSGCTFSQDTDCTYCGDSIIQTPSSEGIHEVCDANNLNNQTCIVRGYASGNLSCSNDCLTFNVSICRLAGGGSPSPGGGTSSGEEPINNPPVLAPIGPQSINEGEELTFTISAQDPDNDTLTYSIQGLVSGTTFQDQTFSWTPTYEQSGIYDFTFIVSDTELTDSEEITITVQDVCVPATCSVLGYECGTWDDGCGSTLNCGTCQVGYNCESGQCVEETPEPYCGDGTCDAEEDCPEDATGCPDNTCYEPTCTNGCGQTAVAQRGTDESCLSPLMCNGAGSCVECVDDSDCDSGKSCISGSCVSISADCTIYVDDCGTTGGTGTQADPYCRQGNDIMNIGSPGDIVCLQDGYYGTIDISALSNSDYITIQAQPEPGHTPTFKRIKLTSCSKWIFKGLAISPEFAPVFEKISYGIIGIWNSQDIIIENNNIFSVQDSSSWTADDWNSLASPGIYIQNSSNGIIRNNTIKNVFHAIRMLWGHGTLIEYNKVEHNAGDGVQVCSSSDVIVQYNTIKNFYTVGATHMDGIQFYGPAAGEPPCNNIIIRGNLIIWRDPGITKFPGDMHGIGFFDAPYDNVLVENNVVIVKHLHGIAMYGITNSKIINNIAFHPTPTYASGVRIHTGYGAIVSNNVVLRNNMTHIIDPQGVNITTDHNIDIGDDYVPDALFIDYLNNDLRHKSDSPAIDAGSPDLAPDVDIEETARPQGTGYDIGAYEYVGVSECSGTDTSCGIYPNCQNCNNSDGCSGTNYRDYYCINNSQGCGYTTQDCSNCSCSCGGYNQTESIANNNCSDDIDNDCDGQTDMLDSGCGCTPDQTQSCDTGLSGVCSVGTQTCQSDGTWGSCIQDAPQSAEICTGGLDEDCDGQTDCGDTDCSSDPACITAIPTDYVAYWKFDGDTLDETGNNNGTIYGDPQYAIGVQGQALDFDGTGDYVDVGAADFMENIPEISVSLWFKLSEEEVTNNFFGKDRSIELKYQDEYNILEFKTWNASGYIDYARHTSDIVKGTWHHCVGTYNGTVKVYLDGVLGSRVPVLGGNTMSDIDNLYIGGIGGSSTFFNGSIDEVMIYDRALSADEIQDIYDAQKPAGHGVMLEPSEPDLRGLASILDAIREILEKIKSLF